MRWTPGGVSGNVEDLRGGGGGGFGGRGVGIGGIFIALILSVVFGRDFMTPLLFSTGGEARQSNPARDRAEEPMVQFVSFVLDDVQNTWKRKLGPQYEDAKLVLFRDQVHSACGIAGSATGPFYCPADYRAYIDLSFYDELDRRFGAPGDFAQAYVLAHEIGHHVQNLLGVSGKVQRARQQASPAQGNALSVRLELQADCFAGVWANSTKERGLLEQGDIQEGLGAAAAVGDDRLQRQARGTVAPETFTHGTSEQRMQWFRRGLESGDIQACDTFNSR